MKKIILGLNVVVSLVSCSNNESKMREEIVTYLQANAKDPKSYEFVELKVVDTVTIGEVNKRLIGDNKVGIFIAESSLEVEKMLVKDIGVEQELKVKGIVSNLNELKKQALTLSKDTINKEPLGYIATHKFRIKNGFGALDLSSRYIQFDKEFKLLKMDEKLSYSEIKKQ
jgi:hypothetical protein